MPKNEELNALCPTIGDIEARRRKLLQAMRQAITPDDIKAIREVMVAKAKAGDVEAAKLCAKQGWKLS
jgi:hypothetical protein